jgi:hypothetical protein
MLTGALDDGRDALSHRPLHCLARRKLMAKRASKKTAKKTGAMIAAGVSPAEFSALFGAPGTTVKIIKLQKDCSTSDSAGRFYLEGRYKRPKR